MPNTNINTNTPNIESLTNLTTEQLNQILQQNPHLSLNNNFNHKKYITLQHLISHQPISIPQIADLQNTTTKNISTLLNYLKKLNYVIQTNENNQKFIIPASLLNNPSNPPNLEIPSYFDNPNYLPYLPADKQNLTIDE